MSPPFHSSASSLPLRFQSGRLLELSASCAAAETTIVQLGSLARPSSTKATTIKQGQCECWLELHRTWMTDDIVLSLLASHLISRRTDGIRNDGNFNRCGIIRWTILHLTSNTSLQHYLDKICGFLRPHYLAHSPWTYWKPRTHQTDGYRHQEAPRQEGCQTGTKE